MHIKSSILSVIRKRQIKTTRRNYYTVSRMSKIKMAKYTVCLQCRRPGFDPWVGKIPWRREWLPTPVFLLGEVHGQRSLAGYSPWGCKELDTTEPLTLSLFHTFRKEKCQKEMATHSSILAWRIPWTEEPGGL